MTMPPLLLGATLLFWGWQTGLMPIAALMALALEGARRIQWRWELSLSDFGRISDLCALAFLASTVFLFITRQPTQALFLAFQWLPLIIFPLILSQAYSTRDKVQISAFFLMLRKMRAEAEGRPLAAVNLTYPYWGLCFLSASAANTQTPWFYIGICLLSAWVLWAVRPKSFSAPLWAGLLVLVTLLGYGGQRGLHNLHN